LFDHEVARLLAFLPEAERHSARCDCPRA
jgi:hypothetical protein